MSLFGYFSIGLQSMNAAQFGLQVAGDNISNAFTPGFVRRRVDLSPGYPVQVPGGYLDQGVVGRLQRMEDMFTQANLQREQGHQAGSEERLRGLRQIEGVLGSLDQEGSISTAMAGFSSAMAEAAAQPENLALRRGAISAAESLAQSIRTTYDRLTAQRKVEDGTVKALVQETNSLAEELAALNRDIATSEANGDVAAPMRDRRTQVVEQLTRLTGGTAAPAADGRLTFSLPGGPTLVTGSDALPLSTTRAADGTTRLLSGADGRDLTDGLREGKLGAVLYVRDESLTLKMSELDTLATGLVGRANTLTTGGFDLAGNPGDVLFQPPIGAGIAGDIHVDPALFADPGLLALSASGAPGDGDIALALSEIPTTAGVDLSGRTPLEFIAEIHSTLGNEIVRTDVDEAVSKQLVESLVAQRDSVSAVSLDEEAVALIENQRAYEAAARFIQVLNSVTEVAISLANR